MTIPSYSQVLCVIQGVFTRELGLGGHFRVLCYNILIFLCLTLGYDNISIYLTQNKTQLSLQEKKKAN